MIEIGSIVELSNNKKYMITASSVENFNTDKKKSLCIFTQTFL